MDLQAPPDTVEPGDPVALLQLLGRHLREARLRRNIAVEQLAQKVGVTRKTVYEAERGNPATGVGVYVRIFCALGIEEQLVDLATEEREYEELQGEAIGKRVRR